MARIRPAARVDRVTPELLKRMAAAGCREIHYGIESGNQAIIDRVGKRITLEQVRNAVEALCREDIGLARQVIGGQCGGPVPGLFEHGEAAFDGGESWENITTPTLDGFSPYSILHQFGTGGVYLGCKGGIFYRNERVQLQC